LRKSVFRAILARVAVLCNERSPNSVSPYGGQGEVSVGADPAMTFRVEFANTPDEQRLELTRVRPKAVLSFPLRFARRSAPQLELTRVRPKAVLPVPSSSSLDRKLINRCLERLRGPLRGIDLPRDPARCTGPQPGCLAGRHGRHRSRDPAEDRRRRLRDPAAVQGRQLAADLLDGDRPTNLRQGDGETAA